MLTGTTNSSRIEPAFVGSGDCQVIEDGNEVDCLGSVSNDIQAVEYIIVGSNRQLPSYADSVSVISDGGNSSDVLYHTRILYRTRMVHTRTVQFCIPYAYTIRACLNAYNYSFFIS